MQFALDFGTLAATDDAETVMTLTPGDKPGFVATESAMRFIGRLWHNRNHGFRWAYCDSANVLHLSAVYHSRHAAFEAYLVAMQSLRAYANGYNRNAD